MIEIFLPRFLGGAAFLRRSIYTEKIDGEKVKVYKYSFKNHFHITFKAAASFWDFDGKVVMLKCTKNALYFHKFALGFGYTKNKKRSLKTYKCNRRTSGIGIKQKI